MSSNQQQIAPNADQRFLDKQMAGVIEAIMTHGYSLTNNGVIPSEQQLATYIGDLDELALVERIRRHPGAASTRALMAEDAELLRWARLIGQPITR